jgi:hypothetical protein
MQALEPIAKLTCAGTCAQEGTRRVTVTVTVSPGSGHATAGASKVAVPGPRTKTSCPKALVWPSALRTVSRAV